MDRRAPGVYVDIADVSYAAPAAGLANISALAVVVGDRGPANSVVEVNSVEEFTRKFGEPNYPKTGAGHYLAVRFLTHASPLYVIRPVCDDAYMANVGVRANSAGTLVEQTYTFTSGSNTVTASDEAAFEAFDVGDWIYSATDNDPQYAAQIIAKNSADLTFTLDREYAGTTSASPENAYKYVPYQASHVASASDSSAFSSSAEDTVWYFYAIGHGEWANNIRIKAYRNTAYENIYIDSSGNPIFKYAFWDIYIYEVTPDGERLLEGPWTVSCIAQDQNGKVIRDPNTGEELYIETVINNRSEFIKCVTAQKQSELEGTSATAETKRLQVLLLLSEGTILNTNNPAVGTGIMLGEGSNGSQYDAQGNLDLSGPIKEKLVQAYKATLSSEDGSIELLRYENYSPYKLCYILCGGWDLDVVAAAVELAELRKDCMVLADMGYTTSPSDDINTRHTSATWSSPYLMLYSQYRQIFDPYTGRYIWITPVYQALECHLRVDTSYFLAEPVAGITKGALPEPAKLTYIPNASQVGDLMDAQINPTVSDPDGTYFASQLTTYKQYSKLQEAHVAKFAQFVRREIPSLVKDLLNRRQLADDNITAIAERRISDFMSRYLNRPGNARYAAIHEFNVNVSVDEARREMYIQLSFSPIGSIHRILVSLLVS